MTTHVEELPDELLLLILDLLPDTDIIDVVPCVCLRWSRLILDSHIWKNRTYKVGNPSDYVYQQSPSDAVKFFSRKPALRSVEFNEVVDEAVLQSLASHCPTITTLILCWNKLLTLDTLRAITRNCEQICFLAITSKILSCPECAREVALMPRLETLVVGGHQELQLRELGAGCGRLRHLYLGSAINFRLGDLGAPLLGRLQTLAICCDAVSPDIVHCAESLKKLTLETSYGYHLPHRLSRPDSAIAEVLQSLKALTHVEATNLYQCPQVVRSLMQPLLRSLNLSYCSNLDDDLLLDLCHRCPLLEELDLSVCGLITDRGLSSMWRLRRLRRLDLDMCLSLGSGAMKHLARCDGLKQLRMSPCTNQVARSSI